MNSKKIMPTIATQRKVLKLIKELVPKQFVYKAYYRVEGGKIEVVFLVKEKDLSSLIGYLNSLASIIEDRLKGVKIESGIFIHERRKSVTELTQKEALLPIELRSVRSLSYAT